MAMAWVWTGMVLLSLVFGLLTGRLDDVANAALEGARSAIDLSISMAGILCLWSGVMEVMSACGLSASLARTFRPLLRRLLPNACRDEETLAAISANVSANLLGLGNAATPLGIRAAQRMARGCGGTARDELCLRVELRAAASRPRPPRPPAVRPAPARAAPAGLTAARLLSLIGRARP